MASARTKNNIKKFLNLGLNRLIFALPSPTRDAALPLLDKYAELKAKAR